MVHPWAKYDKNPSRGSWDIGFTRIPYGRTDGQPENIMPPAHKNSCVGVTRPTLKIPPTLEFFFTDYCAIVIRNFNKAIQFYRKNCMVYFQCSKHVFLFLPVLSMFYEYIHRVRVYKWAYCWVKNKNKIKIYRPTLFSVAHYANTTIFCLP